MDITQIQPATDSEVGAVQRHLEEHGQIGAAYVWGLIARIKQQDRELARRDSLSMEMTSGIQRLHADLNDLRDDRDAALAKAATLDLETHLHCDGCQDEACGGFGVGSDITAQAEVYQAALRVAEMLNQHINTGELAPLPLDLLALVRDYNNAVEKTGYQP